MGGGKEQGGTRLLAEAGDVGTGDGLGTAAATSDPGARTWAAVGQAGTGCRRELRLRVGRRGAGV
jgi:hypothetical protein